MDLFCCNDNDAIDIKFDISLNDDNYLEYIWYVLNSSDNTNQWTNIFESMQNTNDLCDVDSNIWHSINTFLVSELPSDGYQFILPWIDFMMQSFYMNYSFQSSINVKQFDVNCLSIILWYKLFVCINDDDIKSEQDKYQFMIGILDIIFDNFDHKMKHFILKHHFESILYFIGLKWKDCRLRSIAHTMAVPTFWQIKDCGRNSCLDTVQQMNELEEKTCLDEIDIIPRLQVECLSFTRLCTVINANLCIDCAC